MNKLTEKIREDLGNYGHISFARFMDWALYCPVYGYYEKEGDTLGRRGDYFTSVSVGPLFGELLACQFARWLDELSGAQSTPFGPLAGGEIPFVGGAKPSASHPPARRLCLVEAGAHRGHLARDILGWLRAYRPDLFSCIEYWIIEPSCRRQSWQRQTLAEFLPQMHWVETLSNLANASGGVEGIVFSNELLDSLPVHRLGWNAQSREWFEWGVGFEAGHFVWTRLNGGSEPREEPPGMMARGGGVSPTKALAEPDWPPQLLRTLPDGFTIEVCPAATQWWSEAAGLLHLGKLLTLDYGFTAGEWATPERSGGTLRAYRQHRQVSDILADPGEQDLTAHVNFTAIQQAGEAAGLKTEGLLTQERFVTLMAAPVLREEVCFGAWTSDRVRQFQTLTHPNLMGHSFRVLVQSR